MQHAASTPPAKRIDLSTPRKIHIIGIGGSGMSAIATVLLAMGHEVSGSDSASSKPLDKVTEAGATTWVGSRPENLPQGLDAVVKSTAIPETDTEIAEARRRGTPVLRRAEILAGICATKRTIAVAGTHGKTTTSTLLALALEGAGAKPSWIIGAEILGRGDGAHWDPEGEFLVVEADESDGTFSELGAESAIVTNIEPDHLEHYGGWDNLQAAFESFVRSIDGPVIMNAADEVSQRIELANNRDRTAKNEWVNCHLLSLDVDRDPEYTYWVHTGETSNFGSTFTLYDEYMILDGSAVPVHLPIPGAHNVANAAAALCLVHEYDLDMAGAIKGIEGFQGVHRRFQPRGDKGDVIFVDDYAHLPTEVKAALAAAKKGDWKRVVAVFQPHRYSRTEQVGRDFGGAFDDADVLFLTDVYAAGEAPRSGIDGTVVRDAVAKEAGHPPITYVQARDELAQRVADELQPGDLCITLGAGDITKLSDEIQAVMP